MDSTLIATSRTPGPDSGQDGDAGEEAAVVLEDGGVHTVVRVGSAETDGFEQRDERFWMAQDEVVDPVDETGAGLGQHSAGEVGGEVVLFEERAEEAVDECFRPRETASIRTFGEAWRGESSVITPWEQGMGGKT